MTAASILVPSHNRAGSLELAVRSALAQTVRDLEVLIIGDGVADDVRAAATGLEAEDPRVRFLDLPKGPHHGEVHRHEAILAATSDAIFYLCDDDLLLPEHVADLLALLETHSFVQSLNGYVSPDGRVHRYGGTLADDEAIEWILSETVQYNFVSITGTAHSREFYLGLDAPWSTTPPGEWPDHAQWKKMLGRPGFAGATSNRMTALQFPATQPERLGWSVDHQLAELRVWADRIRLPHAQAAIDRSVFEATEIELARAVRELQLARNEIRALAAMQGTLSWRITRPLRAVRRRF